MRKVTQRITALALASAVAFSVLPPAAFAQAPSQAASAAVQAESEAESQPAPEEAASSKTANGKAAASEAADSEPASSQAADSEPASSQEATSKAASSESTNSEPASSEETDTEKSTSKAASSESTEEDQPAGNEKPAGKTAAFEAKDGIRAQLAAYSMELKDGKTTGKEIYDALGGGYTGRLNAPKDSFREKGTDTEIGLAALTHSYNFDTVFTLSKGEHTFQKIVRTGLKSDYVDYATLTVSVYHEYTFASEGAPEETAVFTDVSGNALTETSVKCYDGDASFSFKVADIGSMYNVAVTLGGTVLTPDEDGVYTIASGTASGEVKAVYTLTNGVKITAADAGGIQSVSVNGTQLSDSNFVVLPYGDSYTLAVTPAEGYTVTGIHIGSEDLALSDSNFDGYQVTMPLTAPSANADGSQSGITGLVITPAAQKPVIRVNGEGRMNYHFGMEKAALEASIAAAMNDILDADASVPDDPAKAYDSYQVEYKAGTIGVWNVKIDRWESVDYDPLLSDYNILLHAFGANGEGSSEQVRVTFSGSARYPDVTAEFTVDLEDDREPVTMEIRDGYAVKYQADHDAMDAFVKLQRVQYVTMLDADGKAIPDIRFNDDQFTFTYDHAAGEQELTVTFTGNETYKPASATGKITIAKGDAAVAVNSQTIYYGQNFATPIFTATPAEAGIVGLIGGIRADGGLYAGIDGSVTLNQLLGKEIPMIGDTPLKTFLLGADEIKLSELTDVIQKLLTISGNISSGDVQATIDAIQKAIDALTALVPGIGNAVISFNYPTEAGAYFGVGFTTNQNYNTALSTGTLVIRQGSASITVNSQNIDYGDTLQPVFSCTPDDANGVGIIAGLNADGSYYVGVKFCNEKQQNAVSGNVSLKGLASALEQVPDADTTGLTTAVSILSKMMPGIENTIIQFTDPQDAGVYTAIGFVTNKNYQASPAFGTITIGQNSKMKTLAFNEELPESQILYISEAKSFSFGGYLADADRDTAARSLPSLRIGVNAYYTGYLSDGSLYADTEPGYKPGVYIESLYVIGTNYKAAPISRSYTIINDQITVSPVDVQKTYGEADPAFEVSLRINGGEAQIVKASDYDYLSVVRETGEDAGEYALSIRIDESKLPKGRSVRTDGSAALTILRREVTVQFQNFSMTYGENVPKAQYAFLHNGAADAILTAENFAEEVPGAKIALLNADGEDVTMAIGRLPAGEYTYTVIGLPETCNYVLTSSGGRLTVQQRPVMIDFADDHVFYGDEIPAAEFQVLFEGQEDTVLTPGNLAREIPGAKIVLQDADGTIVTDARPDTGIYRITLAALPENGNYSLEIAPGTLTVSPRAVLMQFADASALYGDGIPSAQYTFQHNSAADTVLTAENFAEEIPGAHIAVLDANGEDVTYAAGHLPVGQYTCTVMGIPQKCNYALTIYAGKLTIKKRPVTIDFKTSHVTYGDTIPAAEFQVFFGDTEDTVLTPENLTEEVPGAKIVWQDASGAAVTDARPDAGRYTITLVGQPENGNYSIKVVPATLTVTPRAVQMQFTDASITYGDKGRSTPYEFLHNDEVDTVLTAENFHKEIPNAKLVLLNANGRDVTNAAGRLPAGEYTCTMVDIPETRNYTLTIGRQGKLTIQQRPVTIDFINDRVTYGDTIPAAKFRIFFDGDGSEDAILTPENLAAELPGARIVLQDASGAVAADARLDVGSYNITLANLPESSNYSVTVIPGTLAVAPCGVWLQVTAASMTAGSRFPAIECSYSYADAETGEKLGPVPDWMANELNKKIVVSYTDASLASRLPIGQYDIVFDPASLTAGNYTSASAATVTVSITGLYDNSNYDVNLFTLNGEPTKLATLTVRKAPSGGGHHSGSSGSSGSSDNSGSTTGDSQPPAQTTTQQTPVVQAVSAQTGDSSHLWLNLAILLAGILGFGILWRKKL